MRFRLVSIWMLKCCMVTLLTGCTHDLPRPSSPFFEDHQEVKKVAKEALGDIALDDKHLPVLGFSNGSMRAAVFTSSHPERLLIITSYKPGSDGGTECDLGVEAKVRAHLGLPHFEIAGRKVERWAFGERRFLVERQQGRAGLVRYRLLLSFGPEPPTKQYRFVALLASGPAEGGHDEVLKNLLSRLPIGQVQWVADQYGPSSHTPDLGNLQIDGRSLESVEGSQSLSGDCLQRNGKALISLGDPEEKVIEILGEVDLASISDRLAQVPSSPPEQDLTIRSYRGTHGYYQIATCRGRVDRIEAHPYRNPVMDPAPLSYREVDEGVAVAQAFLQHVLAGDVGRARALLDAELERGLYPGDLEAYVAGSRRSTRGFTEFEVQNCSLKLEKSDAHIPIWFLHVNFRFKRPDRDVRENVLLGLQLNEGRWAVRQIFLGRYVSR